MFVWKENRNERAEEIGIIHRTKPPFALEKANFFFCWVVFGERGRILGARGETETKGVAKQKKTGQDNSSYIPFLLCLFGLAFFFPFFLPPRLIFSFCMYTTPQGRDRRREEEIF